MGVMTGVEPPVDPDLVRERHVPSRVLRIGVTEESRDRGLQVYRVVHEEPEVAVRDPGARDLVPEEPPSRVLTREAGRRPLPESAEVVYLATTSQAEIPVGKTGTDGM